MANRIIGLDIGTFSVKIVVLETSFKGFEFIEAFEEPILRAKQDFEQDPVDVVKKTDPDEENTSENISPEEKALEELLQQDLNPFDEQTKNVLKKWHKNGILRADAIITHINHGVYTAQTKLPFSDPAQIRSILPPQLDGRFPQDIDELHLDFMICGEDTNGLNRIQAAAVRPSRMIGLLNNLEQFEIDPKILDLAPYHLFTASKALGANQNSYVVVDIGEKRTSILIVQYNQVVLARTFHSGGKRIVLELAETFKIDEDAAREGLLKQGFIDKYANENQPDATTGKDKTDISNAIRRGVKPIIRQLRRTLHAHHAQFPIEHIYFCGGTSLIPGLVSYLGKCLDIKSSLFNTKQEAFAKVNGFDRESPRYIGALGLALRAVANIPSSHFNFRRGDFAFRGNYEHIKNRVPALILIFVAIFVAGLLTITSRVMMLRAESNVLKSALRNVTEEVFGRPIESVGQIQNRLDEDIEVESIIPEFSAYEIFAEIGIVIGTMADQNNVIEARSIEVNMQRGTFEIKGFADNAETVDELDNMLDSVSCLRDIRVGDINRDRRSERFEFEISGAALCNIDEEEEGEE